MSYQPTSPVASLYQKKAPVFQRPMTLPPRPLVKKTPMQGVIETIVVRMQEPEPDRGATARQKSLKRHMYPFGWLPALALTSALGLLIVTYAYTSSRSGATNGETYLWSGLLVIFAPALFRLTSPLISRTERLAVVCLVGLMLYLVKVISSPLYFSFHDEYLHWRTVEDIVRSSHLFSENAMLPVGPLYPGLEIVTHAVSSLVGLDTFHAGLIVIAVARLVMMVSLFMIYEQITKSARTAGLAVMLYMTNPHFLFFDALFSYESLALPLSLFMIFLVARSDTLGKGQRRIVVLAWFTLIAITATHHVTDFFFDGLLLFWSMTHGFLRVSPLKEAKPLLTVVIGISLAVAWVLLIANPVVDYISSFLSVSFAELGRLVLGDGGSRQLFVDYSGHVTPVWERLTMIASVGFTVLGIPFGLLCLWHRYRYNALAYMFGIVSFAYPLSQAFRFTATGSELSDRSAAFIFIGISFVLAIFLTQMWSARVLSWRHMSLMTSVASVIFLGGSILGSGPTWAILPGPYMVIADSRSIEPEGIQAAQWSRVHLGTNQRIATDRTNRLMMLSYGDQRVITTLQDKVDTAPIFYSATFNNEDLALVRQAHVQYLVVDVRLSTALPLLGFYFEQGEQGSFQLTSPISRDALTKFNDVPNVNRIFDSGDIIMYDMKGLNNAPQKP